ncbi:uncharacterized protein LOC142095277 [Mixophyes fleayi]|uniref:uncharacterized protein LOC142095277 n=1 Tax=Mixophyes fleayi TaxID=3061075 RepID=UPI003F4DD617
MDKDRSHMTERILNLTLEILYLLTGEDYTVVKKSCDGVTDSSRPGASGGRSRTQNPIMEPPPHSLIHERNNDQRILELTNKIIQLLTGEVPIRCQDVTVYFSMEEWEYLEGHKDLYKDVMMESHRPLTSLGRCDEDTHDTDNCDEDGKYGGLIAISQTGSKSVHKTAVECVSHANEIPTDTTDVCSGQTEYASIPIKKESISSDVKYLKESVTYAPAHHPEYSPTQFKVESVLCEEEHYEVSQISNLVDQEDFEYLYITEDGNTHISSNTLSVVKCIECCDHFTVESDDTCDNRTQSYKCHKCSTNDSELVTYRTGDSETQMVTFSELSNKSNIVHEDYRKEGTDREKGFSRNKHLHGKNISCRGKKSNSYTEWGEWFTNSSALDRYQRIYAEEELFSCCQSVKYFNQQTSMDTNQRVHTEEKPFLCSQSGKRLRNKAHVMSHQTGRIDDKQFNCLECGQCFKQSLSLVEHMRIHTGEKTFTCPECGQCFTHRSALITHQKTHKVEKLYFCFECGKCFRTKSDLTTHQRIHMGEKPFPCPQCGEGFTRRANLVRHQRIHTGEKPFSCPYCGKCFTRKLGLVKHQRIHTGEKSFPRFHKNIFRHTMY